MKFLLSKKTVYVSFRLGITMGECKAKATQTNLGIFRHNQTYPGIIQAYLGIFRTLCLIIFTNYNYFSKACRVETNILR